MRDPKSVRMAAFTVKNPNDRQAFDWIDRSAWGQGIASQALDLLLRTVRVRPVYARAASDNAGSLGVLRKAGFRVIGTEISSATARDADIEETILRLD